MVAEAAALAAAVATSRPASHPFGGTGGLSSRPLHPLFSLSRNPAGGTMARRNKTSVLKRQRERKKAEKLVLKRELHGRHEPPARGPAEQVATLEDLEGYGIAPELGEKARTR